MNAMSDRADRLRRRVGPERAHAIWVRYFNLIANGFTWPPVPVEEKQG